jgi:quinolinate synthase
MADMAEISQVEACWETLEQLHITNDLIPITYINSSATIKAFVGEHGGLVCTSSNAEKAFNWAFKRGKRILFLPDQHLGRNTGFNMHIPLDEMIVYDPWMLQGGQSKADYEHSQIILWKGHCAVHQRFLPSHIDAMREKYSNIQVIVHPECRLEVCQKADAIGSTERLIQIVDEAPIGTTFAIGTEIHLVNRLAKKYASLGKTIYSLSEQGCLCTTMFRITPQHLAWSLENLVSGKVVNQIKVNDRVKQWAKVALNRMLEL